MPATPSGNNVNPPLWNPSSQQAIWLSLGLAVAIAAVLRCIAAVTLLPHMDEIVSVIAATRVAESGAPVLPSGILYTQGLTLSYLLAPLLKLGLDERLFLRMPGVIFGSLSVAVCWAITRKITGSPIAAGLAALLLACDPTSVQWSIHIRPYALLQLLTLLIIWRFLFVLVPESSTSVNRELRTVVALFAIATFTHIGIVMLLPALVLASHYQFRRSKNEYLRVFAYLAACLCAPVALLLLNKIFGITSADPNEAASAVPMIGNHIVDFGRLTNPKYMAWFDFFLFTRLPYLIPALVALASAAIVVVAVKAERHSNFRAFALLLLALFWLPAIAVIFFTKGQPRYLLHLHSFELILIAVALWTLSKGLLFDRRHNYLAVTVAALVIALLADGTVARLSEKLVSPHYEYAMSKVKEMHEPGTPILVAWPPGAWDMMESTRKDLLFFAGHEKTKRVSRYTRLSPEGIKLDFWMGLPSITSTHELCMLLKRNRGMWVVVDPTALDAYWRLGGRMGKLLKLTRVKRQTIRGVDVWRSMNAKAWPKEARGVCQRARADSVKRQQG